MSRAENAQRVAELSAQSLTGVQISERLGLSRAYVRELLSDPAGHKARARKPSGACMDCGKATSYVTGGFSPRCRECTNAGGRADMRRVHERAERIVAWWADGLTSSEIAHRLGWSAVYVHVEIMRLRKKGYDLPYRDKRKAVSL